MRSNPDMRFLGPAALAGTLLTAVTAQAVVPRVPRRLAAQQLTAMPGAGLTKPLRGQRDVQWGQPQTSAWTRFVAAAGGTWRTSVDRATGVPSQIYGSGIAAPGANASPAIAEHGRPHAARRSPRACSLRGPRSPTSSWCRTTRTDRSARSAFSSGQAGAASSAARSASGSSTIALFLIASEALPNVQVSTTRARMTARFDPHPRLGRAAARARVSPPRRSPTPGDEVDLAAGRRRRGPRLPPRAPS